MIDAGYRKNGTHNDNTVLLAALNLSTLQQQALDKYNANQQLIEKLLVRFDSRDSQMTPWDSDWAGGTEGSDLRIAREFQIPEGDINFAKEVASEVFPLERAVTPFSEYKLRLGIAILLVSRAGGGIELDRTSGKEEGVRKTAKNVRDYVNNGGKLKVGADVLLGLKSWETLVSKPPEVDKLLQNMAVELQKADDAVGGLITRNGAVEQLSEGFSAAGTDSPKISLPEFLWFRRASK